VGIVAERELSRNLRSTKGIAMFVLFFLGGLLPAMIRVYAQYATANVPASAVREAFLAYLKDQYSNPEVAQYIVDAPPIIYFLFAGTLTFLPLVVLLVGFDQIVGEVEHRTLRYSAGRATRASIVTGKALGIWGVAAVMITVLHVTVWVLTLILGPSRDVGGVLSWGGRMLFFSLISASAYVGFASIVSALFRTPIVALFVGAGAGFALWLAYTLFSFVSSEKFSIIFSGPRQSGDVWHPTTTQKVFDALTWVFPNRYEKLLVVPDAGQVLSGLALFIVWGAACVAVASFIVSRRDV
jgi:ABC-type transport system involved in multi-copper enzyme maturation permease subunit